MPRASQASAVDERLLGLDLLPSEFSLRECPGTGSLSPRRRMPAHPTAFLSNHPLSDISYKDLLALSLRNPRFLNRAYPRPPSHLERRLRPLRCARSVQCCRAASPGVRCPQCLPTRALETHPPPHS